jgi:hypothetical protein
LFDPFEEQFNLPALLVDISNGLGRPLANNEPEEVHHRAMMLWAGKYHQGLVAAL